MKLKNNIIKWSGGFILASFLLPICLGAQEKIPKTEQRDKKVEQRDNKVEERDKKVELYYNLALKAYENEEYVAAQKALISALNLNPDHAPALALDEDNEIKLRWYYFEKTIIPMVHYDGISFQEAITGLEEMIQRESNGKLIPNFVIIDKEGIIKNVKISLKLQNVPARRLFYHLVDSAGAKVRLCKYTTSIRPSK